MNAPSKLVCIHVLLPGVERHVCVLRVATAQVELSCSNPGAMKQTWTQRKHLVAQKLMQPQEMRVMLQAYSKQVTKVSYKVLQTGAIFQWLQVRRRGDTGDMSLVLC